MINYRDSSGTLLKSAFNYLLVFFWKIRLSLPLKLPQGPHTPTQKDFTAIKALAAQPSYYLEIKKATWMAARGTDMETMQKIALGFFFEHLMLRVKKKEMK